MKVIAKKWDKADEAFDLSPDPAKPLVAMAFKIVDDPYGQLTFMRIYQGKITKGETYINQRTSNKQRFSRIVRMHADKREEIDSAPPPSRRHGSRLRSAAARRGASP